ncbi:MAG TPA: glycosyltransferase family 4 protein [Trueperaceae bacterium]
MIPVLVMSAAALMSSAITARVKEYARSRRILDVPNGRSLHQAAVPRGGGLGFVTTILISLPLMWFFFPADSPLWLALLGSLPIAVTGWLDDRFSLPASRRFLVHSLVAAWAVWMLGGLEGVRLGTIELDLGAFGYPLAWLLVVWLINLYNFMDGIDGLAAGQAVLVGAVGALLASAGGNVGLAWFAALVAASCAGFLQWNLPPARIFMGDAGSGFLGYVFAVVALYSEASGGPPLLVWLLLLGVFVVDSTATLIQRWLAGERWYEAHRSHAYQRAVQLGFSHRFVTLTVLGITAVLAAVAWVVNTLPALALPVALLDFGLLLLIWRYVYKRSRRADAG